MTTTTNDSDANTKQEFYQRVVLCKQRGAGFCTHTHTFPLHITPEELREQLLILEGHKFNTKELITSGKLLTAHHRLSTDIVVNTSIRRTPIEDIKVYVLLGLKYLLCSGLSYDKSVEVMQDYCPITEQEKQQFWDILTTKKDFLDKIEKMAYAS